MIDGCFAGIPGVGPARERELRALGIACWDQFPSEGTVLSPRLDGAIREAVAHRRTLLGKGDYAGLGALMPPREHWRLLCDLESTATYLDIETTWDGRVTVIGLYDAARGPRLYVRGHNLGAFVDDPLSPAVVTFNGASFDLPILRRTFPGWAPAVVHVDLLAVTRGLGERGGLKAIEERWGLARPLHLKGVDGADALALWDAFVHRRDTRALAKLVEYNLYDVVQLRSVAQIACERHSDALGRPWRPERRLERGEVLYDLTQAVEGVVSNARSIEPDVVEPAERRVLSR